MKNMNKERHCLEDNIHEQNEHEETMTWLGERLIILGVNVKLPVKIRLICYFGEIACLS